MFNVLYSNHVDRIELEKQLKEKETTSETCEQQNLDRHNQLMTFEDSIKNGSLVWKSDCYVCYC